MSFLIDDLEDVWDSTSEFFSRQRSTLISRALHARTKFIDTLKSYQKTGSVLNQEKINRFLQHRQNEEHNDKKSIFYAIRNGEFAQIPKRLIQLRKNLLIRGQQLEDYRDATGATIVHVAYLYNQYKIARYIVQKHPKLGLEPFSDKFPDWLLSAYPSIADHDSGLFMPYAGENILHQAIMMRNHFETRWILEFYRVHKDSFETDPLITLLRTRAQGSFFRQGGQFYFGGYPLHFAVCTNDTDIFDLVLAYATSVGQSELGRKMSHSSMDSNSTATSSDSGLAGKWSNLVALNKPKSGPPEPLKPLTLDQLAANGFGPSSPNSSGEKFDRIRPEDSSKSRQAADQYRDDMLALGPNSIFMRDDIGNTALHICVLHHLQEMYSHIMKESEAMIKKQLKIKYAECKQSYRRYFSVKGLMNIGNYPISSNLNKKIEMPHGDSEYESWLKSETDKIIDERLTYALNNEYHSPLTLAASLDASSYDSTDRVNGEKKKTEMLSFLLKKMRTTKWTYGPVSCTELALEGLEMPFFAWRFLDGKAVENNSKGVIELLCVSDADESIMIPEIKGLIERKWELGFQQQFFRSAIIHLMITLFLTVNVCFINHIPSFNPYYFGQLAALVLYPLVLCFMFWVFAHEFPIIRRHGLLAYWGLSSRTKSIRGAAQFDHMCKSIMVLSFLLFVGFKFYAQRHGAGNYFATTTETIEPTFSPTPTPSSSSLVVSMVEELSHRVLGGGRGRGSSSVGSSSDMKYNPQDYIEFKLCMGFCAVATWLHLYYFLMGFTTTGPFVLSIYRIISVQIPYFLRFYMIILVGFACSLSILLDQGNPEALYGFSHFLWVVWELIHFTVNVQVLFPAEFSASFVPNNLVFLYHIILTTFYISVVLIMLNLLIAMIDSVYDSLSHHNVAILLIEKYNIMASYESGLTPAELRHFRSKYSLFTDMENHEIESHVPADQSLQTDFKKILKTTSRALLSLIEGVRVGNLSEGWKKFHNSNSTPVGVVVPYLSTDVISVLEKDPEEVAREIGSTSIEKTLRMISAKGRRHSLEANGGSKPTNPTGNPVPGRRRAAGGQVNVVEQLNENRKLMQLRGSPVSGNTSTFFSQFSRMGQVPNLPPVEEKAVFEILSVNAEWWDYVKVKERDPKQEKISLLIIDPQNDFHSGGSLAVPNADQDSLRISSLIKENLDRIQEIFVTMDSHYRGHIAHARYWQDMNGNHPAPFTQILYRDLWKEEHTYTEEEVAKRPVWLPTFTRSAYGGKTFHLSEGGERWTPAGREDEDWWSKYRWCCSYVSRLESQGREVVTIWPEHCLVGTKGHCVVSPINEALQLWAARTQRTVTYLMKGQNCNTEMYSAFRADVEDPLDPTTSLNEELLSMLKISDRLVVCGQALSHCVKYTMLDLLDAWAKDPSLICLLKDGCSPVFGYEDASLDFLRMLEREGVRVINTADVFEK